jgi:cytochrome c553
MKRLLFWGLAVPWLLRRLVPGSLLESPLHLAARHPWLTLTLAGVATVAGALLVAVSGVVPIKASSGHWSITERFLQFSKTRSIATHSSFIDTPALDDPSLVLRGAGHFDLGCRPCHGAPPGDVPRIAEFMLPPPPDLTRIVPRRTPPELFYVVKHGIKLTGMPAWTAQQRDDEVWAIVAFLRRLPDMTAKEYRTLSRGQSDEPFDLLAGPRAPPVVGETCARCHGMDGLGRAPGAFPRLAGQRLEYLERALAAYAERRRHSGVMGPIAAALTGEARAAAAGYYASLPPLPAHLGVGEGDARGEHLTRGERLAREGDPARLVPPCVECHGAAMPKHPAYPILAGQDAAYLALQLRLFQQRARGGSEYVHLMHSFVDRLTDQQIDAVSVYFASVDARP